MCKVFFFMIVLLICLYPIIEGYTSLNNIYGDPLEKCKTGTSPGSWDKYGYCSEQGGGVHQICFKVSDDTTNFSSETGQSDWSKGRVNNNHCMCLGAWALYKAKGLGNNKELVCEAIPETALQNKYIKNWNTWNGNELPDQINNGIDSIYEQCYKSSKNSSQLSYLNNLYKNLKKQI